MNEIRENCLFIPITSQMGLRSLRARLGILDRSKHCAREGVRGSPIVNSKFGLLLLSK